MNTHNFHHEQTWRGPGDGSGSVVTTDVTIDVTTDEVTKPKEALTEVTQAVELDYGLSFVASVP